MATGFGGVARNVAESLARLGAHVRMVSRLGRDSAGEAVANHLSDLGIGISDIARIENATTASYTAFLDEAGSLVLALADMAIYDGFTADQLAETDGLGDCDAWFVDANLPSAALEALFARPSPGLIAVDCVSVAKVGRLEPWLGHIDVLFANGDELAALTGHPVRAPLDVATAAHVLRDMGATSIIIARGAEGCFALNSEHEAFFAALSAKVVDVTGAGDALVAGTLYGLTDGRTLDDAVRLGIACATLTVESEKTVPPDLTLTAALARAEIA
jgi:pseudouridine kinase